MVKQQAAGTAAYLSHINYGSSRIRLDKIADIVDGISVKKFNDGRLQMDWNRTMNIERLSHPKRSAGVHSCDNSWAITTWIR